MDNRKKGFTLIELLVVIAVISLLASIILVNVNGFMEKVRDTRRKLDLKSLENALEVFYSSSGHYPLGGWYASCWNPSGNWIADSGNYNWSVDIIQQPHDPVDPCSHWPWDGSGTAPSATYAYYSDNGQRYVLVTRLENGSDRATIQYSNTLWFDGTSLYTAHGWYGRAYVVIHP